MSWLRDIFSVSIGIDLGTVNTAVGIKGSGIIIKEPSTVAISNGSQRKVLAVGREAVEMLGRSPGSITVINPLADGVVANLEMTQVMLRHFISKAIGKRLGNTGVRAVICLPGCVTDIERKAVESAAKGAGAHEAYLIDEPIAAAMGAGLPIYEPLGSMVVDIGGGTTDSAVLALSGIVVARSVRAGGVYICSSIMQYIKERYKLLIGESMAEQIKLELASALAGKSGYMEIKGRRCDSGLPGTVVIDGCEVYKAIKPAIDEILASIRQTLENTPPELAGDLLESGITLTGGSARLDGIRELIQADTGLPVHVAENCDECVALGTLFAAENLDYYRKEARAASGFGTSL